MRAKLDLGNLIGNSGLSYVSIISTMAVGSITKVLLARSLSSSDLGILVTAQTLCLLAANVAQLSIPDALVRFVGRYAIDSIGRSADFVKAAIKCSLVASALLLFVSFAAAGPIANRIYHQAGLASVIIVLSLALPFNTIALVLTSAGRGLGYLWQKILSVDLFPAVSIALVLLIFLAAGSGGIIATCWLYVAASVLSAALAFFWHRRGVFGCASGDRKPAGRELLRFSLPLMAANIVFWPQGLIPLTLGRDSFADVAYYNLAVALSSLVYTVVGAAETAALPVWSNQIAGGRFRELRDDYASASAWCFIVASVVFSILFFASKDVVSLMYGARYVKSSSTLRWIAPVFLLNAATGPNESLLKAFGATRWIFISRLAVGVSVVISMLALHALPSLQRALTSYWLSSAVLIVMYSGYLMYRHLIHPFNSGYIRAMSGVTLALTLLGMADSRISVGSNIGNIALTLVTYLLILSAALFLLGYFRTSDAARFRAASETLLTRCFGAGKA